jgi:predicted RND superfamily exporter protein
VLPLDELIYSRLFSVKHSQFFKNSFVRNLNTSHSVCQKVGNTIWKITNALGCASAAVMTGFLAWFVLNMIQEQKVQ